MVEDRILTVNPSHHRMAWYRNAVDVRLRILWMII